MELKVARRKRSIFIFFAICFVLYSSPLSVFSQPKDQYWKTHTLFSQFPDAEIEKIHQFFPDIVISATQIDLPISFVLAIIKAESNFNPKARSHKGAMGLMQLMPATAKGVYKKYYAESSKDLNRGMLLTPYLNIELGVGYLKHLENTLAGVKDKEMRRHLVIASYNAGLSRVKRSFKVRKNNTLIEVVNQRSKNEFKRAINRLPRETRTYLKRVNSNLEQYSKYLSESV